MRRLIGTAITQAWRLAMRLGLGLRLPAAKIRQHDLCKCREFAAGKVRDAMDASVYWMREVHRLDAAIAAANADLDRLHATARGISIASPTRPIGEL
jgi:hypothetical protein